VTVQFSRPLVTAVIPTRDRAHLLQKAIESYQAAAREVAATAEVEIIVVDNSSSREQAEASREIADRLGVRFLTSSPAGLSRARNVGWRTGNGQFVTFLDDDDAVLSNFFDTLLTTFDLHPSAQAVFGQMLMCDDQLQNPSPVAYPKPPFPVGEAFKFSIKTIVQQNVVMFRRRVLEETQGYDERLRQNEDWDMMLRVAEQHDIVGVEVPVALIRQHQGPRMTNSMTYSQWRQYIRDCAVVDQRVLVMRPRAKVSTISRRMGSFQKRGQSAYNAVQFAIQARSDGSVREARRFVWGAFTRSAPHALKLTLAFRRELLPLLKPWRG
jgi:glycosyltransferase involved in cell wall biosynthesis